MKISNPIVILLCLLALGAVVAACTGSSDSSEDAGIDAGADSDADSDTDVPDAGPWELRCVEGGLGAGEECSTSALCNCDNICGANLFESSNEIPAAIRARFPNYNPDNFGVFYCYAKCEASDAGVDAGGGGCPNATDRCRTFGAGTPREADLCIPTGRLALTDMPVKVYKQRVLKATDLVTGTSPIPPSSVTVNEVGAPKTPASSVAILMDDNSRLNITIVFGNVGELWTLLIAMDGADWVAGKTVSLEDTKAAISLWHSKSGALWYEGPAIDGTITAGTVQPACEDVATCTASTMSFDITVLLSRIGFKRNG